MTTTPADNTNTARRPPGGSTRTPEPEPEPWADTMEEEEKEEEDAETDEDVPFYDAVEDMRDLEDAFTALGC
jgi:hypothetical protein